MLNKETKKSLTFNYAKALRLMLKEKGNCVNKSHRSPGTSMLVGCRIVSSYKIDVAPDNFKILSLIKFLGSLIDLIFHSPRPKAIYNKPNK